jgi:hypothetical protein
MKRFLLMLIILVIMTSFLLANDNSLPHGKKMVSVHPTGLVRPDAHRDAPAYVISQDPTVLLTSYYDYMIGSYNSLPLKLQPAAYGDGTYMIYHGKRTATGQRRVFYTYLDSNSSLLNNNEITSVQNWEGYPSLDIDPLSGKPLFAWHANADGTTDAEYEVQFSWDAYLEGIPGLLLDAIVVIDNPTSITSGTTTTTDNEFLWPKVSIGPSPNAGFRRVYVSAGNASEHTGGKASENVYIAYADFNAEMIELSSPLTWSFTHIPTLDAWNVDTVQWRRPYYSFLAGDDGKIYYIGYHLAYNADDTEIPEPTMDVFINENYGAGEWRQVSADPAMPAWNPQLTDGTYYFTDDNSLAIPDSSLSWDFTDSGHNNAVYDEEHDTIHFPAMFGLSTDTGTYYPSLQALRHVEFDTSSETFSSNQIYPQSANVGGPYTPWDLDDNHQVDEYSTHGYPLMATIWPFCHWDETAHDNALLFHYNNIKMTEPNAEGMMAMVWEDSWRSRMYNKYPESYPDYASYANVPEIYVAVSSDFGTTWSEPIVMNSVETTQLAGMIPMWLYPADKVKFIEEDENGNNIGRLMLMYYDDNSWGSYQQTPPLGQNDGGNVMYMALDIVFPVANEDNSSTPAFAMLKQNYPNPFNPETKISFDLPKAGKTDLNIYNAKGQLVRTLVSGNLPSGVHSLTWNGVDNNGNNVASGLYFYQLSASGKTETRKMMLMK